MLEQRDTKFLENNNTLDIQHGIGLCLTQPTRDTSSLDSSNTPQI